MRRVMTDRQFSDLHLTAKESLSKKVNKGGFLLSTTSKYDTMLTHKPPLKERVDIINKRSFEKFIHNSQISSEQDTNKKIRISKSKLFTLTSSIEDSRGLNSLRRIKPEHRSALLMTESVISTNNGFNTQRTNESDIQRSPPTNSTYYMPNKTQKVAIADSLVTIKAELEKCYNRNGPIGASIYQNLLNSFEKMVTDESFYSETMREMISVIRRGVFFNEENRNSVLPEIHRLDEEQINSIIFLHANKFEPTQQEIMKQLLHKMCLVKNTFKNKIADLEKQIYGKTVLTPRT